MREFSAERPPAVAEVQVRVIRDEPARIFGNNKVGVWAEGRIRGEGVINTAGEPPIGHVHGVCPTIVELHILIIIQAGDRVIHYLVDDNRRQQRWTVVGAKAPRRKPIEVASAVRNAAERNPVFLRPVLNGVNHACAV